MLKPVFIEDLIDDLKNPSTAEDKVAQIVDPSEVQDDEVFASLYESLKPNEVKKEE